MPFTHANSDVFLMPTFGTGLTLNIIGIGLGGGRQLAYTAAKADVFVLAAVDHGATLGRPLFSSKYVSVVGRRCTYGTTRTVDVLSALEAVLLGVFARRKCTAIAPAAYPAAAADVLVLQAGIGATEVVGGELRFN